MTKETKPKKPKKKSKTEKFPTDPVTRTAAEAEEAENKISKWDYNKAPLEPPLDQKLPKNYQGSFDEVGFYIPTEKEVRDRWADIHPHKDISNPDFRMKIWRHPPTRNLIPFYETEDAQAYGRRSELARINKIQKYKKDVTEKAMVIQVIRDELNKNEEDIDPWQLLQLRAKMAMLNDDWDKVESLAMNMLEYTQPKLARIESKVEDITKGNASVDDMQKFISGDITYDEFLDKQQGAKPQ